MSGYDATNALNYNFSSCCVLVSLIGGFFLHILTMENSVQYNSDGNFCVQSGKKSHEIDLLSHANGPSCSKILIPFPKWGDKLLKFYHSYPICVPYFAISRTMYREKKNYETTWGGVNCAFFTTRKNASMALLLISLFILVDLTHVGPFTNTTFIALQNGKLKQKIQI